jgi:hypothetical protein
MLCFREKIHRTSGYQYEFRCFNKQILCQQDLNMLKGKQNLEKAETEKYYNHDRLNNKEYV